MLPGAHVSPPAGDVMPTIEMSGNESESSLADEPSRACATTRRIAFAESGATGVQRQYVFVPGSPVHSVTGTKVEPPSRESSTSNELRAPVADQVTIS